MSRTFSCFLFAITLVLIANNFGRPTPSLAPRPSLDAAVLLRARRKAASSPMSTSQQQQLAMHVQPLSFPPPAPSAAIGGAPFSPGQSDRPRSQSRKRLTTASTPGNNELWAACRRAGAGQQESDNVQALLEAMACLTGVPTRRCCRRRAANARRWSNCWSTCQSAVTHGSPTATRACRRC